MVTEIVKGAPSVRSHRGATPHYQKHVPKVYTNGTSKDTFVFFPCEMTIAQRIARPRGQGSPDGCAAKMAHPAGAGPRCPDPRTPRAI